MSGKRGQEPRRRKGRRGGKDMPSACIPRAQPTLLAWPQLLPCGQLRLLTHSFCIHPPHLSCMALDASKNSCPQTCSCKDGPSGVVKDTEATEGWPRGGKCTCNPCAGWASVSPWEMKLGDNVAFCIGDASALICL